MELYELETYNDGVNTATVRLRRMIIDFSDPKNAGLVIIMEETRTGAAGDIVGTFTLMATNEMRVPVFQTQADGSLQPVMVDSGRMDAQGQPVMVQDTIGEFDMWRTLAFDTNTIGIKAALDAGVKRKKGLSTQPLGFLLPV